MQKNNRISGKIINTARKLKLHDDTFTLLLAAVIGLAGGYFAIGFRYLIVYLNKYIFFNIGNNSILSGWWRYLVILVPVCGLLIVAFLTNRLGKEAKGHGVPEIISSVVRKGGIIRPRIVFIKMIASALCISSGGSVGREGPIAQIGAATGSAIGQFFNMSGTNICILVGCGASAGISATFNAPIAGAIFASEIILGELAIKKVSPLLISSLIADYISRIYFDSKPVFLIPEYNLYSFWELFLYAGLGVLSGLVAVLFIKFLYKTEDIFDMLKIHWKFKAVIGGLLLGITGMYCPEIFG